MYANFQVARSGGPEIYPRPPHLSLSSQHPRPSSVTRPLPPSLEISIVCCCCCAADLLLHPGSYVKLPPSCFRIVQRSKSELPPRQVDPCPAQRHCFVIGIAFYDTSTFTLSRLPAKDAVCQPRAPLPPRPQASTTIHVPSTGA